MRHIATLVLTGFALFLAAVVISLIAVYPRVALVVMAYSYVVFALVFWILGRLRRHHDGEPPTAPTVS